MDKSYMDLRDKFAIAVLPIVFKCVLEESRNEKIKDDRSYLDDLSTGEADGSAIVRIAYVIAEEMMSERLK